MKLKAQRVISVPMEVARTDESLHQYLSPPQPYRLGMWTLLSKVSS